MSAVFLIIKITAKMLAQRWYTFRRSHGILFVLSWGLMLLWLVPLIWIVAISFRPPEISLGRGSSLFAGTLSWANYARAWRILAPSYANTLIMAFGTLAVQLVTITLAGYAFARLRFPGQRCLFIILLIQIMIPITALIIPNFFIIRKLGLYDTVLAVMVPYFGSAFGVFLMRQTFRGVPIELEEAARIDGANLLQILVYIYIPSGIPGLLAFSFASIIYRWNDFLLPLLVTADKAAPLSVRLSILAASEGGIQWPQLAAATVLVISPLVVLFAILQKQFVRGFSYSGLK
jgi:sn-glycerol 3-phosphate transport system permease protein